MSSVGPMKFMSLPDLTGDGEDIYVDPDRTSTGFLIAAPSTSPHSHPLPLPTPPSTPTPPSKHVKPATLPKPSALRVAPTATHPQGPKQRFPSPSPSQRTASPVATANSGKQGDGDDSSQAEDDYESPEVFKIDAEQQKVEVRVRPVTTLRLLLLAGTNFSGLLVCCIWQVLILAV